MSDYLDPNNEELLKDFFAEATSQVEALEQNILVLENDPGNKDAVDEIFRAAHTLKGGAGTVEMTELAHFTHLVEDVLDGIRSGKSAVSEPLIDALLSSIDVIKAMLDAKANGVAYTGDTASLTATLASFQPADSGKPASKGPAPSLAAAQPAAASQGSAAASKAASASQPAAVGEVLSEYELLELREAAGPDRRIYRLRLSFNPDNVMNTVSAIHAFAALRDLGTVLKTTPDFEKLYEDAFYPSVDYYLATDREADDLKKKALIPDVVMSAEVVEIETSGASAQAPMAAPSASAPKPAPTPSPAPKAETAPKTETATAEQPVEVAVHEEAPKEGEAHKPQIQQGSVLRVDSKRIDNLLNLVSETVINKATFNQISSRFGDLQTELQQSQGRFREELKSLFDELPEQLAAVQAGKSPKEIKKDIVEKYGSLYDVYDGFEASLKNDVAKFRSTAQNLGRITGELQEGVMKIRMVPISQIFSRFPRLVRDLSKTLNKKVNLVIEGEDTELDKSVIEDLLDPLMASSTKWMP